MSGKMTLLELTQNILSSMDSDEVNSIGDTVESLQVAEEVRNTYYELLTALKIPSNEKLLTLEPLSDPSRPNYLKIPDNVQGISWVKYKDAGSGGYRELRYVEPEDFIQRNQWYENSQPFITVTDPEYSSISLNVLTNSDPSTYTTFNNSYLVFDSYNSAVDSSLQESKVLCLGQVVPVFKMADDFVPELDVFRFPLLLSAAKAACFVNFKQISNASEERRARRQMVRVQNDQWRADQRRPYNRLPDYGRNSRANYKPGGRRQLIPYSVPPNRYAPIA